MRPEATVRTVREGRIPRPETERIVPGYFVERRFADGLDIPTNDRGAKAVGAVVATNADHGVT